MSRVSKIVVIAAVVVLVGAGAAMAQTTHEVRQGTVVTTYGDTLVVEMSDGTVREIAVQLLEVLSAYLRADEKLAVFANIRGESPEDIAEKVFSQKVIGGLQGPTISQVITREGENWYAVHLIVSKSTLHEAIKEIRSVGGSGVVVSDVNYIFEEEPEELKAMFEALA